MDENIFGSHPTTPNEIECPANVDLKRVPPRIRVPLGERCGATRPISLKTVTVIVFLLTLLLNGYEPGVRDKHPELPKALQHLLN